MVKGIYKATQGMVYEALRLDIIANNLANVDSAGYKKSRLQVTSSFDTYFNSFLRNYLETKPSPSAYELPELMLVRYDVDHEEGAFKKTDGNLDLAINGKGFFGVQNTDGSTVYTRDGAFHLDNDGTLVTQQKLPVLGENSSPVQLPIDAKRIEITPAGEIFADGNRVTSLMVVNFQPPPQSKLGNNLFISSAQPIPVNFQTDDVRVMQGFLESSNVNTIHEMVQMIETLRNFEGYQRAIRAFEETVQQVNEAGRA